MTPDTAALRALADAHAPLIEHVCLDPATVRALCDAADEVERLRAAAVDGEMQAETDREQRQRHYITDIEAELAAANRELARLRRTYEPEGE